MSHHLHKTSGEVCISVAGSTNMDTRVKTNGNSTIIGNVTVTDKDAEISIGDILFSQNGESASHQLSVRGMLNGVRVQDLGKAKSLSDAKSLVFKTINIVGIAGDCLKVYRNKYSTTPLKCHVGGIASVRVAPGCSVTHGQVLMASLPNNLFVKDGEKIIPNPSVCGPQRLVATPLSISNSKSVANECDVPAALSHGEMQKLFTSTFMAHAYVDLLLSDESESFTGIVDSMIPDVKKMVMDFKVLNAGKLGQANLIWQRWKFKQVEQNIVNVEIDQETKLFLDSTLKLALELASMQ